MRQANGCGASRAPVRRTIKALINVRTRLTGIHLAKTEDEWVKLNDTIRDMVATASECLGVSYTLVETTPPTGDGTVSQQRKAA